MCECKTDSFGVYFIYVAWLELEGKPEPAPFAGTDKSFHTLLKDERIIQTMKSLELWAIEHEYVSPTQRQAQTAEFLNSLSFLQ